MAPLPFQGPEATVEEARAFRQGGEGRLAGRGHHRSGAGR